MSNLTQSIAELKTLMGQVETELLSLQAGKKASAPRVRASLQKIKALSHSMRTGIMEHVKALPTKTKTKKVEPVEDDKENVEPVEDVLPVPPVLEQETPEAVPVKPNRAPRKKIVKDKA